MLTAALLSFAAIATPPQSPSADEGQDIPPIQEQGDDYILNFEEASAEGGEGAGLTLDAFVKICQEATGINFTYTRETAGLLSNTNLLMFGTKRIPKSDFYSFFQIMMIINDFVCSRIGPEHLSVILVQNLNTGARNTLRQTAVYLQPDDLESYADQPATLVTTVLNLPNTDVRTLSNSLRTMLTDANTQNIIPVGSSDSVILTGFGSQVAALAKMLLFVDQAAGDDQTVVPEFEVIPLEFASAEEIADLVEELLEASRRVVTGQSRPAQGAQGPTGALQAGQAESRILVDPRTNSLLVMALPDDIPRIMELVARLDVDVIERERTYHIYALNNVGASEISEVLNEFLQDAVQVQPGSAGQQARPGGTGGATRRSREFVVVPDPNSNSLLIAATRTHYQEVIDIVRLLDRRQDQVLIETALIELSGTDVVNLGVEWILGDVPLGGSSADGGFGVTSFGLSTIDVTTGLRVPNLATGLTAGIIDGDDFNLPFLINAFEQRDDTNVVNVPSVLVSNNSSATVTTLDERPTTQVTANGGGGVGGQTQTNFAGYEEAGVTMQISPSISSSSYLRLSVSLEVSNFRGVFSEANPIPPPRITRTIDTVVNVPDGDTMVIGGIVSDQKSTTTRQLPFLGDIPLLGALFRSKDDSKDKTTLFFFVTPHILSDPDFADLAEISYQKKLDAADYIGADRIRRVDPDFGQSPSERIFQGFDVPIYQAPQRGEVGGDEVGIDSIRAAEMLREEAAKEEAQGDGK